MDSKDTADLIIKKPKDKKVKEPKAPKVPKEKKERKKKKQWIFVVQKGHFIVGFD